VVSLTDYLADLRRRKNIEEDGEPFEDDPPEPYEVPIDTAPAFFVQALNSVSAGRDHAYDREQRHIYADMILCDLLLFAMNTHEDGDVVNTAHQAVEVWRSLDKWYA